MAGEREKKRGSESVRTCMCVQAASRTDQESNNKKRTHQCLLVVLIGLVLARPAPTLPDTHTRCRPAIPVECYLSTVPSIASGQLYRSFYGCTPIDYSDFSHDLIRRQEPASP